MTSRFLELRPPVENQAAFLLAASYHENTRGLKRMNQLLRELQEQGRCIEEGRHELFFSELASELAEAQLICSACPVRERCLQLALQENLEWGVWGGVIFWDGQAYFRRRGRGRPRHSEAHLPVEADRGVLLELVRSA